MPIDEVPPVTDIRLRVKAVMVGALTLSVADFVVPLESVAVIVDVVSAATGTVAIVKPLAAWPGGMVTDAGSVATDVLLELKLTTVPPTGARIAVSTTPLLDTPPVTGVVKLSESAGAVIDRTAVAV